MEESLQRSCHGRCGGIFVNGFSGAGRNRLLPYRLIGPIGRRCARAQQVKHPLDDGAGFTDRFFIRHLDPESVQGGGVVVFRQDAGFVQSYDQGRHDRTLACQYSIDVFIDSIHIAAHVTPLYE
jgi:hypothetical protein